MNNSDPYTPPCAASSTPEEDPERGTIPRPLVRIGVGICAAFFLGPACWVIIVTFTEMVALAELLVLPAMIAGGIAVGWASYFRFVLPRVVAWGAAGLGAGLVLEAILMGGLGIGTFITPSGIVLGLLGIVLGTRARPQIAK